MQNIVKTQYERCRQILISEQLNLIAETLLEIETLDREQIEGLFYHGKLPERNFDNEPDERMRFHKMTVQSVHLMKKLKKMESDDTVGSRYSGRT